MSDQVPNIQMWYYLDHLNQVQGPYPSDQMQYWYMNGYLLPNLSIFPADAMKTLDMLIQTNGAVMPFKNDTHMDEVEVDSSDNNSDNDDSTLAHADDESSNEEDDSENLNMKFDKMDFPPLPRRRDSDYSNASQVSAADASNNWRRTSANSNSTASSGENSENSSWRQVGILDRASLADVSNNWRRDTKSIENLLTKKYKQELEEVRKKLEECCSEKARLEKIVQENLGANFINGTPNDTITFVVGRRYFLDVIEGNEQYCKYTDTKRCLIMGLQAARLLSERFTRIAVQLGEKPANLSSDVQFNEMFVDSEFQYTIRSRVPTYSNYEFATFVIKREPRLLKNNIRSSYMIVIPAIGVQKFVKELKTVLAKTQHLNA